jgi:hypothetical protein
MLARPILAAGVLLLLGAMPARGDPLSEARRLSADPNTPATGATWRAYMHGSMGGAIPLLGDDEDRLTLRVPLMVELSNRIGNVLPNNYWRGELALAVGLRVPLFGRTGQLTFEVHHESDHRTTQANDAQDLPRGFLQLNSIALSAARPFWVAGQPVVPKLTARLHLVTCTKAVDLCSSGDEGWGSTAFEASGELTWTGAPAKPNTIRPVASLFFDLLLPHHLVRRESRIVGNFGAWIHTRRRGDFEVYGIVWLGNDVGYTRATALHQLGVGARWIP